MNWAPGFAGVIGGDSEADVSLSLLCDRDDMVSLRLRVVSLCHDSGRKDEILLRAPNSVDDFSEVNESCVELTDVSERRLLDDKDLLLPSMRGDEVRLSDANLRSPSVLLLCLDTNGMVSFSGMAFIGSMEVGLWMTSRDCVEPEE